MTKQAKKQFSPEKLDLIMRSQAAKELRAQMIATATSEEQAFRAASLTINDLLIQQYKSESGATLFKTSKDWKEAGYSVRKGEKAFRVWGTPRTGKVNFESADAVKPENSGTEQGADDAGKYEFFPVACLFSNLQVDKIDPLTPDVDSDTAEDVTAELEDISSPAATESAPALSGGPIENAYVNSNYEQAKEDKADRLLNRAQRKAKEADAAFNRSRSLVEHIPFGQPILVGHHSERKHRAALDKSWSAMGRSVALNEHAEKLERRAASVGTAGIASDDPNALQALQNKLDSAKKAQEKMKKANQLIRAGKADQLSTLGFSESDIKTLLTPAYGQPGFASYSLSNNNAEIKRLEKRIKALTAMHNKAPLEVETEDYSIYVNDGRICVKFAGGKPTEQVRKLLRTGYAFVFRSSTAEWVRKTTPNALVAAELMASELAKIDTIY